MRAINENTLAVLKSQRMIEQDKFNYQVMLEGYDAGYGGITSNQVSQWIDDADVGLGDIAVRSDGKIMVVYRKNLSIYISYVDNEDILLDNPINDLAVNEQLIYTCSSVKKKKNYALLRLKNGKILLFISDNGVYGGASQKTIVYQSSSGNGDDFALLSTISTRSRVGFDNSFINDSVGTPSQMTDGSILICLMGLITVSGYDYSVLDVYKSTDNGTTWSRIYRFDFYESLAVWGQRMSSIDTINDILPLGDIVICSFFCAYSNNTISFYSTNGGLNWSNPLWSDPPLLGNLFPYYDGGYTRSLSTDTLMNNIYYLIFKNTIPYSLKIYSMPFKDATSISILNDIHNWQLIGDININISTMSRNFNFRMSALNKMHFIFYSALELYEIGMAREHYSSTISASSISISKGRGGANTAAITADNKDGELNPMNPDSPLYGVLNLNKQIIVKMGYGPDLIETFTGMIDEFSMKSYPHLMDITCRDNLKKALDQTITEGNHQTVAFTNTAIESIFGYLCYLAGIETGTIEATGINISKVFSWQSYADAFQFLSDLASFEYGADEYGKVYFRRDYQPNNMAIAYTFEEGVDIKSMSYKLSDDDLYYRVKAYGKSGDTVLVYDAPFVDAAKYNILPQKVLKVDATEASTVSELRTIAERALYLMNSRTAIVEFEAIAVPWLQVGDFIQVYERSSMSTGIYRISSMTINLTPKTFTMRLSCYYYGDSIVIGELPTETATQTADPNLNLIPEMTSNTAPSGVARASSIYNGTYEPWQALNSTDADYYWNSIAATGWIEYQFTELTIVDKYMLKARQALEYNYSMPKNWTFEGFDGAVWVVLDTRTNQSAWGINEQRQYLFTNTQPYIKYRLNVSANNGYSRLQLEQLAMYYGGGS